MICAGFDDLISCVDSKEILVFSPQDLQRLCNNTDSHFILMNDVDLTKYSWNGSCEFAGVIRGRNHTISANQRFLLFSTSAQFFDLKFKIQTPENQNFIRVTEGSLFYNV